MRVEESVKMCRQKAKKAWNGQLIVQKRLASRMQSILLNLFVQIMN